MSRPAPSAEALPRFLARLDAAASGRWEERPAQGPDLPDWLVQLAGALWDGQDPDAAGEWARRMYDACARLDGRVPFGVVHDWHARTVAPLLGEGQEDVRALHLRALAGESVAEDAWAAVLEPALRDVHRRAYPYADAFATAAANARAWARTNDYGETEAEEFADGYARLNTGANVTSCADANALVHARASAAAFAAGDAVAYAACYPFAAVNAYALALAGQDTADGREERHRAACGRLADGLAESLERAAGEPERGRGFDPGIAVPAPSITVESPGDRGAVRSL
ncbi:SpcZ [Streptomyces sp. AV19]|uniref:SpcZ n=1 Tax=Streptomyces sp. AV19 TaxID=2793068 RepID=UPI0018FEC61D|nr:SpcZ [Streptomyces sp. AV19]MBH1934342.1 SpcZ [Streptomyces sp. AV19]MDG4533350.1 SpcZ [Streptomyces sp. AV19]